MTNPKPLKQRERRRQTTELNVRKGGGKPRCDIRQKGAPKHCIKQTETTYQTMARRNKGYINSTVGDTIPPQCSIHKFKTQRPGVKRPVTVGPVGIGRVPSGRYCCGAGSQGGGTRVLRSGTGMFSSAPGAAATCRQSPPPQDYLPPHPPYRAPPPPLWRHKDGGHDRQVVSVGLSRSEQRAPRRGLLGYGSYGPARW